MIDLSEVLLYLKKNCNDSDSPSFSLMRTKNPTFHGLLLVPAPPKGGSLRAPEKGGAGTCSAAKNDRSGKGLVRQPQVRGRVLAPRACG